MRHTGRANVGWCKVKTVARGARPTRSDGGYLSRRVSGLSGLPGRRTEGNTGAVARKNQWVLRLSDADSVDVELGSVALTVGVPE